MCNMKKTGTFLLLILAVFMLLPGCFLLTGSFMGQQELLDLFDPVMKNGNGYASWKLIPEYPKFRSYVKLLLDSPSFFSLFWNSVKLTFGVLLGQLLIGTPAAWGFAKYHFAGKNILFTIYMILMMMPFQVLMLSNYLVLDRMGLLDTLAGIILPAIFSTFPVFIMYRFFESVPDSLLEAARLDGAGEGKLFLLVGLPLGSPGVISAMVLGFLEYWNLMEQPMAFLKSKDKWPLSLFLPNIDMEQAGLAFAASVVVLIPAMLVFLAGQDYLEQGIISTAVKE